MVSNYRKTKRTVSVFPQRCCQLRIIVSLSDPFGQLYVALARNNFLKQSKALILLVPDQKRINWRDSCIYIVGFTRFENHNGWQTRKEYKSQAFYSG
jgi:hypothetical protein